LNIIFTTASPQKPQTENRSMMREERVEREEEREEEQEEEEGWGMEALNNFID